MIERFYYRLIDCQPWADAAKRLEREKHMINTNSCAKALDVGRL